MLKRYDRPNVLLIKAKINYALSPEIIYNAIFIIPQNPAKLIINIHQANVF
jgi:hypothetical protein